MVAKGKRKTTKQVEEITATTATSADINGWEVTAGCFVRSSLLPVAGITLRHTASIVPPKHPLLPGWYVRLGNGGEDFIPDENVVLVGTREMVEAANASTEDDQEAEQDFTVEGHAFVLEVEDEKKEKGGCENGGYHQS